MAICRLPSISTLYSTSKDHKNNSDSYEKHKGIVLSDDNWNQRHNISIYLKFYAQIDSLPLTLQLISQPKRQHMFQNYSSSPQEIQENMHDNHFDILEKSDLVHHLHGNFHNPRLQQNFQEVFLTDLTPNWSNLSVCTQEDRNVETFLLGGDDLGESVDHFFNDPFGKQPIQEKGEEPSASNIQKQGNIQQQMPDPVKCITTQQQQPTEKEDSCHDQTKNIPKNYIKAIFTFVVQNQDYIERLARKVSQSQVRVIEFIKEQKKIKKYTIQRLKSLWTHVQNGKLMRIISAEFLRKRCLGYIFGSKIEKKMAHVKHRLRFMEGIENPYEFSNIK